MSSNIQLAICKFEAINSSYCGSVDYFGSPTCHCGMNPGEICQGHDDMPGTPDYGDFSDDYNINNCAYTFYGYDYEFDVFQCVEDTESNSLHFS